MPGSIGLVTEELKAEPMEGVIFQEATDLTGEPDTVGEDVSMGLVAFSSTTGLVWEEDFEDGDYLGSISVEEAIQQVVDGITAEELASPGGVTQPKCSSLGSALSTRKSREARRLPSPWTRRYKSVYRGAKLVPFGSKCIYLNDGSSRALGRPAKYEPRGRVGLVLGYGPLKSYLVLDERLYTLKGQVVLRITRDLHLYASEFPLHRISSMSTPEEHLQVLDRLTPDEEDDGLGGGGDEKEKPPRRRFQAGPDGKCRICKKVVVPEGTKVTCSACRNPSSTSNHTYGKRCRLGRCQGHEILEEQQGSGGDAGPGAVSAGQPAGEHEVQLDANFVDAEEGGEEDDALFGGASGATVAPPAVPAPPPSAPPMNESSGGGGGALHRSLERAAQALGTGAIVTAAHVAGIGPLGTAVAEAVSGTVGEAVRDAVAGLTGSASATQHLHVQD